MWASAACSIELGDGVGVGIGDGVGIGIRVGVGVEFFSEGRSGIGPHVDLVRTTY
jgi:hypothetical protein